MTNGLNWTEICGLNCNRLSYLWLWSSLLPLVWPLTYGHSSCSVAQHMIWRLLYDHSLRANWWHVFNLVASGLIGDLFCSNICDQWSNLHPLGGSVTLGPPLHREKWIQTVLEWPRGLPDLLHEVWNLHAPVPGCHLVLSALRTQACQDREGLAGSGTDTLALQ